MFTLEAREYFKCSAEEKKSCLATIDAICILAEIARDQGMLALENGLEMAADEFLLQTGMKMLADAAERDEIKAILETYIVSSYKTGVELLRQVIVLQGILEIQGGKAPQYIKKRLLAFLGEDFAGEDNGG